MPPIKRSEFRGSPAAVFLAIVAAAITLAASAMESGGTVRAQQEMSLGVDMVPGNNSAAFVGSVQTCREAEIGDQFAVDVFVRDVERLAAWELRIGFDHNILSLNDANYNFFLLSTQPSGGIFPSLFDVENLDRYFLAAAELRGTPDSGSGVLARLQFTAVGQGRGPVIIVAQPSFLRPRLTNGNGQLIGDTDGDGLWDKTIIDGEVAIGQSCSLSPPPSPLPSPLPSPSPSPSPSPPPASSPTPAPPTADEESASTETSIASTDAGGDSAAALVAALPALLALSDVAPPEGESDEGATSSEPPENQPDDHATEGVTKSTEPQKGGADGGGSSSFPLWLIGAIIGAGLVIGTGGTVVLHMLRYR